MLLAVGAVVQALDLAELQRVEDEADVAVRREPGGVVLVRRLAAVGDAAFNHVAVPADVEDRRQRLPAAILREVEVRGDVQTRHRLEVQLLDDEPLALDGAGDDRLEVGLRGERIEAHHVEELPPQFGAFLLPCLFRGEVGEAIALDASDLILQVRVEYSFSALVGVHGTGRRRSRLLGKTHRHQTEHNGRGKAHDQAPKRMTPTRFGWAFSVPRGGIGSNDGVLIQSRRPARQLAGSPASGRSAPRFATSECPARLRRTRRVASSSR